MSIPAELVKDLREKSGAGIMACKEALKAVNGNTEKAIDYLRKKGLSQAARKLGRQTSEGVVGSYIHGGGKIGVLLEINCETDFVARNSIFQELVKDVSMHIAAVKPMYLRLEDVPSEEVQKEKAILAEQARHAGKSEKIIPKIVEGRLSKFYGEKCLLMQPFVKDRDKIIDELLKEKINELGENITIKRFVRYQLGESQ